jgi:uncharacterized OsmC-like protein
LEARGIPANEHHIFSEVEGEIEKSEDKGLVVRCIHVTYHLKVSPEHHEIAERVLGFHADHCPVARTIRSCVDITTSLEMEDLGE